MFLLGEKIRIARQQKQLTQKQLGKALGVSHAVISNWEKEINRPDIDMLEELCKLLDINPNDLFNMSAVNNNLSHSEQQLINEYKSLDKYGKKVVNSVLKLEMERIEKEQSEKVNNIVEMQKPMTPEETKEAWGFEESARDTYGTKDKYNTNFTAENVEKMKEALDLLKRGEFNNGDHKR